jgi:Arc/MetJ-type ribon-helix-helix transcriptional regulator
VTACERWPAEGTVVARRRATLATSTVAASVISRSSTITGAGTPLALGAHPMPSVLHEVLRELFAKRPDLIAPLLERRLDLPAEDLIAIDSELTDPRLKQLLPDVVLASRSAEDPLVIVIVEVHLKINEVKRRVWPQYAATAHGRYGCPVLLVVVTPWRRVERWARQTIEVGPGHTMTPHVLGPKALPLLEPDEVKRSPVLAMLSTLANLDDPQCAEQAIETLVALATWDEDADGRLGDILQAALPKALLRRMEKLMRTGKYEYQTDYMKQAFARGEEQGREEGRAAGEARALLLVLRSRGIEVPAAAVRRIETERDDARFEAWIRRAATATTLDDVFTDD